MTTRILREYVGPAVTCAWVGVAVLIWDLPEHVLGKDVVDPICFRGFTHEYLIGIAIVLPLGFMFHRDLQPLVCSLSMMLVPIILVDVGRMIAASSMPNAYPAFFFVYIVWAIPYVVASYGGAYVRRNVGAGGKRDVLR